jgi:Arc/MetJ family transcription regulator
MSEPRKYLLAKGILPGGVGKAVFYMRITIHIEDNFLADLMRLTQATTKAQAVRDALKELIRLRRKEELLALRGRLEIEDNWRQLRESELEEA